MITRLAEDCYTCILRQTAKQVVWGDGPEKKQTHPMMFIAEAPGRDEDREGRPLCGKSGKEFDWLLARNGIQRADVYVTNIVKCRPPGNRDPKPNEIGHCSGWLNQEIDLIDPEIIVTVGRFATRVFLPDANMEMCHGIPFRLNERIIIPVYHIAAGLHDPNRMMSIQADFRAVREVVRGEREPRHIKDPLDGQEVYEKIDASSLRYQINTCEQRIVAIDTEWGDDQPLCTTISFAPGQGFMIDATDSKTLNVLNKFVLSPDVATILHNALYDIPVLAEMHVNPAKVMDTMIMAYLLQGEPQGLKPLAYRHCGMRMNSYKEAIYGSTRRKALQYLAKAVEYEWPDSEPILEWPKGNPHIRRPQNIGKKIARILLDSTLKDADPYERWKKIKEDEGRGFVEACLGKLYQGNLSEIEPERAIRYACRDADATLRVYHKLWPRIVNDELERVFWIDMNVVPMAVEMMRCGILVDVQYLRNLTDYFQKKMDSIEDQITRLTGCNINVGSPEQVADLLYNQLKIKPLKKTRGGKNSTEEAVLSRLAGKHEVVKLIQDHRELTKLKGTYTEAIPKFAEKDGRVRARIKLTRTSTGRLSMSDPNLQNQPVRSEEGRKIRKGFIASDGCSLVSSDYSQIELRMMAHMSGDSYMVEIFKRGEDIHSKTASEMFGIPIANLDKMKHRYPAKRTNFGIPYGITAEGLYRDFRIAGCKGWSVESCQDFINEWFDLYKGYAEYLESVYQFARMNGYVKDFMGRRRYVPGLRCINPGLINEALRMAGNMPIQAGAQEVIKIAMGELIHWVRKFTREGHIFRPLIQIHDDLLSEVGDSFIPTAVPIIKGVMENAVTLRIPTPVEPEIGKNWAEMKKWRK